VVRIIIIIKNERVNNNNNKLQNDKKSRETAYKTAANTGLGFPVEKETANADVIRIGIRSNRLKQTAE
jgi:hypothetical protein